MIRTNRVFGAVTGLFALAGCSSLPSVPLPSVPTSIFSGADLPACPDLRAGPGPYAPPFPAECRTMNKTASGVRYIPITNGDINSGSPKLDSTIVVNYEAFLAGSGTLIDSSYARGESSVHEMTELIDGWAEAVQLMNPGDEWLVFVPSAEAFGTEPLGDLIPANSDLVYRVKLDGFLSQSQLNQASSDAPAAATPPAASVEMSGPDMAAWQAHFPWDASKPSVTTLPSGLSLVTLERGSNTGPTATREDMVRIHYEGRLVETSEFFDSSWSTDAPATFPVGGLIPGFTEALTFMRPGDRVLAHIPAALGYGANGAGDDVPPDSDLMFQIVMLEIVGSE